jgi:predicted transcriptional regulator
MNINLYENKSGHYEHIYFIIKLYENKSGHYKHIYFNIKFMKINQDIIVT